MAADSTGRGYDISLWYDSKPVKIGWFAMLAIGIFWVLYQRAFGYSHGLDSMTPEFDSVWMGLWRFNILANAVFFAVTIGWIWVTRDRNLANLDVEFIHGLGLSRIHYERFNNRRNVSVRRVWGIVFIMFDGLAQLGGDAVP